MNANGSVGVADERLHVGWRERAELVERAQRGDDGGWLGVLVGKQFAQRGAAAFFSPRSTSSRCAVWRRQKSGLAHSRASAFASSVLMSAARSARRVAMREAIDAAAVVAGIDAVLLLEMARDGRVVLDDFAVVVDDPDASRPARA